MNNFFIGLVLGALGAFSCMGIKKVVAQRKDHSSPQEGETQSERKVCPSSRESEKSAKGSFVENLDKFKSLLPLLNEDTFVPSEWTDLIVGINNEELTEYWSKAHKSVDSWCRLLASWGIKADDCMSFKAMNIHKDMYMTEENSAIELGQMYQVLQKCWLYTNPDGEKSVIVIGKAKTM